MGMETRLSYCQGADSFLHKRTHANGIPKGMALFRLDTDENRGMVSAEVVLALR